MLRILPSWHGSSTTRGSTARHADHRKFQLAVSAVFLADQRGDI